MLRRAFTVGSMVSAASNAKAAWDKRSSNPSDAAGHGAGAVTSAVSAAISAAGGATGSVGMVASGVRVAASLAAQHTHGMVREGPKPYVTRRTFEALDSAREAAAKFMPPVDD